MEKFESLVSKVLFPDATAVEKLHNALWKYLLFKTDIYNNTNIKLEDDLLHKNASSSWNRENILYSVGITKWSHSQQERRMTLIRSQNQVKIKNTWKNLITLLMTRKMEWHQQLHRNHGISGKTMEEPSYLSYNDNKFSLIINKKTWHCRILSPHGYTYVRI